MPGTSSKQPNDETPLQDGNDSGYHRLEDQIEWYDRKSVEAQRIFRTLKIIQIFVAALIPVVSLVRPGSAVIPGILGAVILILEGIQELGMYRQLWQKYRSACEALRHEKFLYIANSGFYKGLDETEAKQGLAERVEALISEEHTTWVAQFRESRKAK